MADSEEDFDPTVDEGLESSSTAADRGLALEELLRLHAGPPQEETLSVDPEDLATRALEEATESEPPAAKSGITIAVLEALRG